MTSEKPKMNELQLKRINEIVNLLDSKVNEASNILSISELENDTKDFYLNASFWNVKSQIVFMLSNILS